MLCKYKHMFGKPNEGVHSLRLFDIAFVDVLFTLLGALIIHYTLEYNFWVVLIILFIIGIIAHHIFCVDTTINKLLFGKHM